MRIAFGTQSYRHASLPLSAQEMVNCYLEPAPPQAKTLAAVPGCYGISSFATVGNGPIRGVHVLDTLAYVVSGSKLYSLNADRVVTELGDVPGYGRVSMAGDETNVMVVTNPDAYVYDGSTVAQITDPDFPGAAMVAYLDGYFLIAVPDSGQFYLSANRNPLSWNALDFATAEKYPDGLIVPIVNYGEAVLFGRQSFEVWANTGDADFTLERIPNGIGEKGCAARFAACKVDNQIGFVGNDYLVYLLNGYQPQRISTFAVEQAIANAEDKDFVAMSWLEGGHTMFAVTCDDFTFVYDVSSGLWHRRESSGQTNWRVSHSAIGFGRWLVGDDTNRIGYLDANAYSEWGEALRASCASPPVHDDNKRLFHSRLELVFEQGVGLSSGQGSDPQVMLQWSDDGGRTWSSEYWRSLGAQGEYRSRAVWNRLGSARDRVYRYSVSDPVRRTLILATAEVIGGTY